MKSVTIFEHNAISMLKTDHWGAAWHTG